MSKAPASQFYWADLRRDAEYHMMDWSSRGIWIEMLSCMHFSTERGKLEGTLEQLSRMIGCTPEEFQKAKVDISVTKTGDVTESNGKVTIINRRMYREEKQKISTRLRVDKFRKRQSNADVTPPSSSSSSSSDQNKGFAYCAKPVEKPEKDYPKFPKKEIEFVEHQDGSVEIKI